MMKKGYIGVELGYDTIKVVRIILKRGKATIAFEKVIKLTNDCVKDGMLIDSNQACELVGKVIQEHQLKEKSVYVVIKSGLPIIRTIPLTKGSRKRKYRNLSKELKARFPVALEGYWVQLSVSKADDHCYQSVVTALPALNMMKVMYFIKKLGLRCLKITVFSEGIRETLLKTQPNILEETVGVVVEEESNIYLTIMQKGIGIINRNILLKEGIDKIKEIALEIERVIAYYNDESVDFKLETIYLRAKEGESILLNYLEEILGIRVVYLPYLENKQSDYMGYLKGDMINFAKGNSPKLKESKREYKWGMAGLFLVLTMGIAVTNLYVFLSKSKEYDKVKAELEQPRYKNVRNLSQQIKDEQELLRVWSNAISLVESKPSVEESIMDMVTSNIPNQTEVMWYSFESNKVYLEGFTKDVSSLEEMIGYFKESYPGLTAQFQVGCREDMTYKVSFSLVIVLENIREEGGNHV